MKHESIVRLFILGAATAAAFLAFPCAVAATATCEQSAKESGRYIRAEDLGDWDWVDDRTLIIWVPNTLRAHLVRLSRSLPNLADADHISIVNGRKDGVIFPCGHDGVELDDDARTRASIARIEPLSDAQAVGLINAATPAVRT